MSISSMERDGLHRFSNGQYGSLQVSNGGGGGTGSAISSRDGSPETTFKTSMWHQHHKHSHHNHSHSHNHNHSQSIRGQHLGEETKIRRQLPPPQIRFRECQKNHAACLGGHAVDGCGEFLPSGKEGTPEALKCAACSCHRNFHRREFVGPTGEITCRCGATTLRSGSYALPQPLLRPLSPVVREKTKSHHQLPSSADISPHAQLIMPLAQFEEEEQEEEEEEDDDYDEPPTHNARPSSSASSKKKRFRTKFTADQKERMQRFADTIGWRISKPDEDAVQGFCDDVGVQRNVFKVWMHNNKHMSSKKIGGGGSELSGRNYDSPEYDLVGKNCESPSNY